MQVRSWRQMPKLSDSSRVTPTGREFNMFTPSPRRTGFGHLLPSPKRIFHLSFGAYESDRGSDPEVFLLCPAATLTQPGLQHWVAFPAAPSSPASSMKQSQGRPQSVWAATGSVSAALACLISPIKMLPVFPGRRGQPAAEWTDIHPQIKA